MACSVSRSSFCNIRSGYPNYADGDVVIEDVYTDAANGDILSNISSVFGKIFHSFSSFVKVNKDLANCPAEIEMQEFSRKPQVEPIEHFSCEIEMQVFPSKNDYCFLEIEQSEKDVPIDSKDSSFIKIALKICRFFSDLRFNISSVCSDVSYELKYRVSLCKNYFLNNDFGIFNTRRFKTVSEKIEVEMIDLAENQFNLLDYPAILELIRKTEIYLHPEELRNFDILSYLTSSEKNKSLLEELKEIKEKKYSDLYLKIKNKIIDGISNSLFKIYQKYISCSSTPKNERTFEEMHFLHSTIFHQNFIYCDQLLSECKHLNLQPLEIIRGVISYLFEQENSVEPVQSIDKLLPIQGCEKEEGSFSHVEI